MFNGILNFLFLKKLLFCQLSSQQSHLIYLLLLNYCFSVKTSKKCSYYIQVHLSFYIYIVFFSIFNLFIILKLYQINCLRFIFLNFIYICRYLEYCINQLSLLLFCRKKCSGLQITSLTNHHLFYSNYGTIFDEWMV